MSIKQQRVETITVEHEQQAARDKRTARPVLRYAPLWFALLVSVVIRTWLVVHTNGVIDGDEAVVAIQAQHILRGEFPLYFYGQAYMGSLEAYLIALVFAVAGSSVWTLRAEPILLSLLLVWLTWKLAGALGELARLSPSAQLLFQAVAAFVAALPPLYDVVVELRTLGGYIETFVLMLLLLLWAVRLTQRWEAGASRTELTWRWIGIGFVVGLGLWVDPLIVSAIAAAAFWIAGYYVVRLVRLRRHNAEQPQPATGAFLKTLVLAIAALPAAVIGCAPALYWGATHQWQNVTYVLQSSNAAALSPAVKAMYPTRFALFKGVAALYMTCIAPRMIGGAIPSEPGIASSIVYTSALALSVVCIFAVITLVACSLLVDHPLLIQPRKLAGLPLLFAASTAFLFCASTISAFGIGCGRDFAGRYATPLVLALPFFFAAIVIFICISITRLIQRPFQQAPGEQNSPAIPTSAAPRGKRNFVLGVQGVLAIVALFCVFAQVNTYMQSNPDLTFQSPYCTVPPANNDPIIAYLRREHIHYGWAAKWVGFPIIFKTQGSIILADPQPVLGNVPTLNRFPQDVVTVQRADRPSILLLVLQGDLHPPLLQTLDAEHVTYRVAFFPSQPGRMVMIITPLNRTVSPFAMPAAFNGVFHCTT